MKIWQLSQVVIATGLTASSWAQPSRAAAPTRQDPINIGAISTLAVGPADFASSGLAAKAVFDSVNASGGIQNRKLVFIQEDDQGNPAAAAEAAARLINASKVVAMAGGTSFLECSVNARTYQQVGLASIPGLGLDQECFTTPMIAPVNSGPYMQFTLALQYATDKLQKTRMCVMRLGKPDNVQKTLDGVLKEWTEKTGKKPVLDERDILPGDSPEPYFKRAVQARCDAVVFAGTEEFSVRFAVAGKKMMPPNTPLVFQGSVYTSRAAELLGRDGEGIYSMSEFEPWSSRSGQLSHWRSLMVANQIPVTSSSQSGYLAAQILVKVMRGIKGDITRESVTKALQQTKPFEQSMLAMPFTFGDGPEHHPNQAAIPVRLIDGRWRIAHHEWLKPSASAATESKP